MLIGISAHAQQGEVVLVPGKAVEREIVSGETHIYSLSLLAGQWMHVVVEQQRIDLAVVLIAPDGRQLAEADISKATFGQEPLSYEAAVNGDYKLIVRTVATVLYQGFYHVQSEANAAQGVYRVQVAVKAATAQDKQRGNAERQLAEAVRLSLQGAGIAAQAIEPYQQAQALWRELGDRHWEAQTFHLIGLAYAASNRHDPAIESFNQALTIRQEIKDRAGEGSTLAALGRAYLMRGPFEKAIIYFEQALAISREVKDRVSEGSILNGMGFVYGPLGNFGKAVESLEQALVVCREVKELVCQGSALHNLGNAHFGQMPEKALEYYEQALAVRREAKDRAGEASTLNNLANVNNLLSRYEKAIEYLGQSLAASREIKQRRYEGNALLTLGETYHYLHRYEKAIEQFEQALTIFREDKDKVLEGDALGYLADSYNSQGRYDKAIEYIEQAVTISRTAQNRTSEGRQLLSLGEAYDGLQQYEQALMAYEQALSANRVALSHQMEGRSLTGLGLMQLRLGRPVQAAASLKQAVAILREAGHRSYEVVALTSLAQTERALGNPGQARTYVEDGLRVAESLRSEIVSPESRASFLTSVQDAYQLYTDLLMRQHQTEPGQGLDALAVEASERRRARSLLDLLGEARADVRQNVDAALLERERLLSRQLNNKAQRLIEAKTPEQSAALKQEISRLEADYEQTRVAIRKSSPRYARLTQPEPLKLKEMQQQLDADTLLLEYALGKEHSYLWAITNETLTSYELPPEEQIQRRARQVYELLAVQSTNQPGETPAKRGARLAKAEAQLSAAAQSLSQVLLSPVTAKLSHKRLVIVADGVLQYIPFSMLPDPVSRRIGRKSENQVVNSYVPLIAEHEIINLPSASALAVLRTDQGERTLADKEVAILADPIFSSTDPRIKIGKTGDSTALSQTGSAAAEATTLQQTLRDFRGQQLERLFYSRDEAEAIYAVAPAGAGFKALDFRANRETATNADLSNYRIIHFATHGLLNAEHPELSGLVLSLVDEKGQPQDGFLRLHEIYNLKLNAELVVLSACQTALGKEIKGEGLIGLTRGFMYAGAPRVVASLWKVEDVATSELMKRFYRAMLQQKQRPAAALRAAQLEMMQRKRWQSPFYWAAFTLQGEWK